jgi:hypothetical protein
MGLCARLMNNQKSNDTSYNNWPVYDQVPYPKGERMGFEKQPKKDFIFDEDELKEFYTKALKRNHERKRQTSKGKP